MYRNDKNTHLKILSFAVFVVFVVLEKNWKIKFIWKWDKKNKLIQKQMIILLNIEYNVLNILNIYVIILIIYKVLNVQSVIRI